VQVVKREKKCEKETMVCRFLGQMNDFSRMLDLEQVTYAAV
jgi:hypothetical protein